MVQAVHSEPFSAQILFLTGETHLRSRGPFNGKLPDELLNGEIFYNLKEAQILVEH